MEKKKCLLSFVGLSRSYLECFENIKQNIILNNLENFDFHINVNTDLENTQTKKWSDINVSPIEREIFEENLKKIYDGFIKNISYLHIDVSDKSGTQIFRERCKFIFNLEKDEFYDLYIFIRFDVIISKPIDLLDFISDNKKFSFITGGYYNNNRLDHTYDWDYCWIGDKVSIDKWLNYYSPILPNRQQVIDTFKSINGFNGTYINDVISGKGLTDNWVNNYWRIFYNLLLIGCEVSFECEKKDIFLKIVR